ncbi:MAG: hypothetical protein ACOVSW_23885 [Candidatus Kapaibacteriota bacterium]
MKNLPILLPLTFFSFLALVSITAKLSAQTAYTPGQTYFGTNSYIEYVAGNLPVIISAAHGGDLSPAALPTRNCAACVTISDANTQELVRAMGESFRKVFGCFPHLIINRLHRRKLDANREIGEAALGNVQAEKAWSEFHQFIDSAKQSVLRQFGRGLYLDMHGHGHDNQRLELGYLLRDDELRLPDDSLNTARYIGFSSVRNLAQIRQQIFTHAQLLRGDAALGTMLARRGFPSVPSKQDPYPLANEDYFDGGYNTARHSSYRGGAIDGVQIECNMDGVRDSPQSLRRFSDSIALSVRDFMQLHYGISLPNTCLATSTAIYPLQSANIEVTGLEIFPQPIAHEGFVRIPRQGTQDITIQIFTVLGSLVQESVHHSTQSADSFTVIPFSTNALPNGVYMLTVRSRFPDVGNTASRSRLLADYFRTALVLITH